MNDDLHYLSATEALARFRDREPLARRAARRGDRAGRGGRADRQRALPRALRRGARGGPGGRGALRGPRRRRAARARGHPARDQGGGGRRGPAVDAGLADLQGPRRRGVVELRPADARRRRDRPRAHDRARVLLRAVHALAPARRHAQPVEPGVRRRRLVRRRGRGAGVRDDDARERLATSAARSARPPRSTGSSASSRPTAACPRRRRSTSTRTATAGRSPARWPTRRSTRTCSPGRTRRTSCRCGRSTSCRRRSTGVEGLRLAVSVDLDGSWPVDAEIRRNTLDAPTALRAAGAIVDEVAVDVPNDARDARRRDPLPARLRRR